MPATHVQAVALVQGLFVRSLKHSQGYFGVQVLQEFENPSDVPPTTQNERVTCIRRKVRTGTGYPNPPEVENSEPPVSMCVICAVRGEAHLQAQNWAREGGRVDNDDASDA